MKKSNGFTLIELLATIIILAGIALIAFPILLNAIKNSEGKIEETTEKLVINATKLYIDDNLNKYIKSEKNTYCIPISTLVESGQLKKEFVESSKEITKDYNVEIKYNKDINDFSYNISDECQESYLCNLSNKDKQINIGDEVTCGTESFYVISNDNESIEMLAKFRIDLETEIQNTGIESCAPNYNNCDGVGKFSSNPYWVDADGNTLSKYSKGNPDKNGKSYYYIYDKEAAQAEENKGTVVYYVYKYGEKLKELGVVTGTTKLMSYEQAINIGCERIKKDDSDQLVGKCDSPNAPEWVYNVTYWLGSTLKTNYVSEGIRYRIWSIDEDNSFDLPTYQEDYQFHGVRPVVKIATNEIKVD